MTYFDLGPYSRKITTSSQDAQTWFDRGLNWLFGFNHYEAIRCFQKALKHDGECAMAHWGISYASGPNYNLPWVRYDPLGRQMALSASWDAMQAALVHAGKASPVEQAMIKALAARYPQREAIEDMSPWDKAYTREMRKIFAAFPDDLEVRGVLAESIMNETPWQMWDLPSGKPAEGAGTEECRALLESALDRIPAAWAEKIGLINRTVPVGRHLDEALAVATKIARIDPDAVAMTKQAINRTFETMGLREALRANLDIAVQIENLETPERKTFQEITRREGLKAAIAWRDARFAARKPSGSEE